MIQQTPIKMKNLTPSTILSDFKALAKELKMDSVHAELSQWNDSAEIVKITMYSSERKENGQQKYAISVDIPTEFYNIKSLELRLRADLIEEQLRNPAKS